MNSYTLLLVDNISHLPLPNVLVLVTHMSPIVRRGKNESWGGYMASTYQSNIPLDDDKMTRRRTDMTPET